jgi:beta-lactamase superfamily II metal-dependent hydrolase
MVHIPRAYGYTSDDVAAAQADELVAIASARGVGVRQPFAGEVALGGSVTVVGPSEPYYIQMLQEQTSKIAALSLALARAKARVIAKARQVLQEEPAETLVDDEGGTTPRNNSSAILSLASDGERMLFTGDAGVPALTQALDFIDANGLATLPLRFLDVPHHGSRHNVSAGLLNRILSPAARGSGTTTAFISSSDKDEHHPSPKVTNALGRRACAVFTTEDYAVINHHSPDAPPRPDYVPLTPTPWLDESD